MSFWTSIPLWGRVLIGLVLGALTGLAFGNAGQEDFIVTWIKPLGDAFVNLIRMLIVPLVFTTLVSGVTAMGDPNRLGSLGGRTIGVYLVTTAFAVTIGLILGTIIQPGKGVDHESAGADTVSQVEQLVDRGKSAGGVVDRLLDIIPPNPVEALAEGNILSVIFFAIIFGVGIISLGEKSKPIADAIDSAANVMIKVTEFIMETAPFGVFALMAWVMATQGLAVLDNLLLLALSLYLGCFIHIILVYGSIIRFVLGLPAIRFFRGIFDAQAVAFSTASSSATLPVTIACARDNLGVSKAVAGSVLPLGATINMDGTAIYLGLIALFAAQALGIDLTFTNYLLIALTATLASVGAAGIPSAGLFLAATVLSTFNVSDQDAVLIIAFIFPFDRLLDMMRTATNITGDAAVASAVAKWEGELDEEIFRTPARV